MARSAITEGIYSAINTSAILALLGSSTSANHRIYGGAWPQEQPVLTTSTTEPDEGWMVFWQEPTTFREDEVYEYVRVNMAIFTTRPTLADDVLDLIDATFNWRTDQQNLVSFGERILLMSQRTNLIDEYEENIKLYRKTARYQMKMVRDPWPG